MTQLQKNEKAPKMKKTKQETLHKIGVFYKIAKNGNGNIYVLGHNF